MITQNNGMEIPQIGVGTWTLKDEIASTNVRLALEAGFRLIDTAQMYDNEEVVKTKCLVCYPCMWIARQAINFLEFSKK